MLSIYAIGGGDLLEEVFNAIATVFNNKASMSSLTGIAIILGGMFAIFEFAKSKDILILLKWFVCYCIVTSCFLYPKTTVVIEDRTGIDIKPRIIDHVPLALAIFGNITSSIGVSITENIETVFHLPNDMEYNKTGMLMGSKLVLASRSFQITDADFSQTINEFMQQCVFYDLLLNKYTVSDLMHTNNPWEFIKAHTSVARAFPLNGEITICKTGAGKLDELWKKEIQNAATIYGGQILGNKQAASLLFTHLSKGYEFLTQASAQGEAILQTNVLANALSQSVAHYGANANAPAALQAYEDTKSELQTRETMDQTGRQAGIWLQQFVNTLQAVVYSLFIFVYFLSYLPFGFSILKNYVLGIFFLQSLAPMYAIINFAANFYAHNRSMMFLASDQTHSVLSISNVIGIAEANADAMALAGYLMWPVTIGAAIMIFRGMPMAMQSMGQLIGGVVQHAGSHVAAESVGGNLSVGNTSFGNHSSNNVSSNHWDTNARYAAGGATMQTSTGSSLSITPSGTEVLDNRGGLSNLGVAVNVADSIRTMAANQAQSSLSAGFSQSHAAGEHYSAALRKMDDFSHQQSQFNSSGNSFSSTETSGFSQSAHTVSQLVDSFAKEHHVSHERAAQVLGQVYADAKVGGGFIAKAEAGASTSASASARSSFGSLYNEAHRFAVDHNFSETVDSAKRAASETHFRNSADEGSRFASSIASSFDKGDSFRTEAASQFSKSESYSNLASTTKENAASINANYTQEFYEWMRHQPSPSSMYGQGTISKSAIDNMAVHDTALLQSYADRYVNEKTNETVTSFNQSHHITNGGQAIKAAYRADNETIAGKSTISNEFSHFNQTVQNDVNRANRHGQGIGYVDSSVIGKVQENISSSEATLKSNQEDLKNTANKLENKAHEKVKGQVLGSIDAPKESLAHIISNNNQ